MLLAQGWGLNGAVAGDGLTDRDVGDRAGQILDGVVGDINDLQRQITGIGDLDVDLDFGTFHDRKSRGGVVLGAVEELGHRHARLWLDDAVCLVRVLNRLGRHSIDASWRGTGDGGGVLVLLAWGRGVGERGTGHRLTTRKRGGGADDAADGIVSDCDVREWDVAGVGDDELEGHRRAVDEGDAWGGVGVVTVELLHDLDARLGDDVRVGFVGL